MNERVKKLAEEISKLPPEEQADLMDELLVLTHPVDREVDKAWAAEIELRLAAHRRGEAKAVPLAEVMDRLRKRFGPME
jgi:putative addiction module component (TIGR02574 family)